MHPEYFQEVTFCFKKKFPISAGNYYVFFFSLAKDRLVSKKFDLLFLLTLIVLLTITGNNYILYLLYLSRSLNIKKCAITCEISDWVSLLDAWVDVKCTKSCHLPFMQLLIWEGWNNVIFNFDKQLLLVIWVLCQHHWFSHGWDLDLTLIDHVLPTVSYNLQTLGWRNDRGNLQRSYCLVISLVASNPLTLRND